LKYSSLHVHTVFCDGEDEIETYCRAALEGGFTSLGFSAHAPIYAKTGISSNWHLADDHLASYIEAVRDAARRWAGKIPVYLGLEVDYIEGRMGPADPDYRDMGLDYIIGSVHYVFPLDGGGPFAIDGPQEDFDRDVRFRFGGDGEVIMEAYWDTLGNMIHAGHFDILGHMDLVKKNNPEDKWFSRSGERYLRKIRSIAELIAWSGVIVEVNTGGLNRGRTKETYPSREILAILRKWQVPVTVTADAHRAADLGGHYGAAWQTLLEAGYSQTVLFARKGKWIKEKII
jgi:histidinol-phosphatase (PHP family)